MSLSFDVKLILIIFALFQACSYDSGSKVVSKFNYQTIGLVRACQNCAADEICDYYNYVGSVPTCRKVCSQPGQMGISAGCKSHEICNPITSTCQSSCTSDQDCSNLFAASGVGHCSSQTTAGYCQLTMNASGGCQSNNDLCGTWDSHLKCNQNVSGGVCMVSSSGGSCPGGQQATGGFCEYSTCQSTCQNNYNCQNGYCLPPTCGSGPSCGTTGCCNNSATCSCGSGSEAACVGLETCSANFAENTCSSIANASCMCGTESSCVGKGLVCSSVGGQTACACNSSTGLTCGAGTCQNAGASGVCQCGSTKCSTGQTCSADGNSCITPAKCGGVQCGGSCVDGICITTPGGDGTCQTACPSGQICFQGQCASQCANTSNYCLTSETCSSSSGQCECGDTPCSDGQICSKSSGSSKCIQQCGDGYIENNEVCDEGLLNGQNGHCASDCKSLCVLQTTNGKNYWEATNLQTALGELTISNSSTGTNCSSSTLCPVGQMCVSGSCYVSSLPTTSQTISTTCPNGVGIWLKNGTFSSPVTINQSVAIYGGFAGTEKSPADRIAQNLTTPLGQDSPSQTILQLSNNTSPNWVLNLGMSSSCVSITSQVLCSIASGCTWTAGSPGSCTGNITNSPAGSITVDGVQIIGNGANYCTNQTSSTACSAVPGCTWNQSCTGVALSPSPLVSVGISTTALLRKVRIADNQTPAQGGGISNEGTLTVADSMISLNQAQNGGGIVNLGTGSLTTERVTFFGNAAIGAGACSQFSSNAACTAVTSCFWSGSCSGGASCSSQTTAASCTATSGCSWTGCGMKTAPTCLGTPYNCSVYSQTTCPGGSSGCSWNGSACAGAPTQCNQITTQASCVNGCYWPMALGGAIYNTGSDLNIYASKFNANYSYGLGGAVHTASAASVVSSLFAANWASNAGGGLYLASATASSNLYNLTMIDNSAYNQGGGGIFDAGSGSSMVNSLFRDNKGLYPVNTNNYAEWVGNRGSDWTAQLNSISSATTLSQTTPTSAGNKMTLTNVDLCPVMSYGYNSGSGLSPSGVCDGVTTSTGSGLVCGSVISSSAGPSPSFNKNALSKNNTCNRTAEFLDCTPPLYRNCSPVGLKTIPGTQLAPPVGSYSKDITGAVNAGVYEGAYQVQCGSNLDCSGSNLACNISKGLCVPCVQNSDCSGSASLCNSKTNQCVQCLSNSDCSGALGICTNNQCTWGCANDADCAGSQFGNKCNIASKQCYCDTNSDCTDLGYSACNTVTNQCVCGSNEDCMYQGGMGDTCANGVCNCGGGQACSDGSCVNHQCPCGDPSTGEGYGYCPSGQTCTFEQGIDGYQYYCIPST